MSTSRETILSKLRAARAPFPSAPPRPKTYLPVANLDGTTPAALVQQFSTLLQGLMGQPRPVQGDAAARAAILEILREHQVTQVLAWDFAYIPVAGLKEALAAAGIQVLHPELRDEFRAEVIEQIRAAGAGITGADAAIAATGTLVFSTAAGRGRVPTILPPVHIAVITLDQLLPRLEDWVAQARSNDLRPMRESQNICFITGPSRTGDIEMVLVLQVHGPGHVYVVIKTE